MKTLKDKVLQDLKGLREVDAITEPRYQRALAYLATPIGTADMEKLELGHCIVEDATEFALFAVGGH